MRRNGLRAVDAGRDEIDHGLDVGGGVPALDGGPDGAGVPVAQHHHKRAVQVLDGVLDAAQNDRIDHVASDADNEDVPQALVEDQFRRDAGVAAADDDGERLLPRDQLLAAGGRDVPGRHRRLDEAGVALPQEGQCLIGCDRRGSDGPRRGRGSAAGATDAAGHGHRQQERYDETEVVWSRAHDAAPPP